MVLSYEEQIKLEEKKHELRMKRLEKVKEIVELQNHDLNIEHI